MDALRVCFGWEHDRKLDGSAVCGRLWAQESHGRFPGRNTGVGLVQDGQYTRLSVVRRAFSVR